MTVTERIESLSARLGAALDELAREGAQAKPADLGAIECETAALCRELRGLPADRRETWLVELEALTGQLSGIETLLERRLGELRRGLVHAEPRAPDVEG